jgi:hypothetical protein
LAVRVRPAANDRLDVGGLGLDFVGVYRSTRRRADLHAQLQRDGRRRHGAPFLALTPRMTVDGQTRFIPVSLTLTIIDLTTTEVLDSETLASRAPRDSASRDRHLCRRHYRGRSGKRGTS